jgi:crotonobetainyl-CoA:carnitine CoA-transferase CaiB-like acyl-CoA transferase
MPQPLQGIRVLEWGIYHAGPGGCAILGDLGAEVIKIEQPKVGDPLRPRFQFGRTHFEFNGRNLFFEGANRNKKSITLDLSREEGREIAYHLVAASDIFLTNVRNETVEKMKMSYPILRQINPRLIYATVSAFGPYGPDSQRGGFDYQGQARSGMMFSMGEPEMPPLLINFGVVDQATAIMASHAILSALVMRERFGLGQQIDVSILGSALAMLYFNVMLGLLTHEVPRQKRIDTDPLRNYYQCKEGKWICFTLPSLLPSSDVDTWKKFCQVVQCPDLENDAKFDSPQKRMENSGELVSILDGIFATKTREEWHNVLGQFGLLSAPVNTPLELKDDPQIVENKYIVDFDHPVFGKVQLPGYPVHFSQASAGPQGPAPELGEHTEQVLREIGGYSDSEIKRFKEKGIV